MSSRCSSSPVGKIKIFLLPVPILPAWLKILHLNDFTNLNLQNRKNSDTYLIQPPCISRLVSFDQLHREFTQSHGNLSENVRILHKPWFPNFNMNRTNLICKVNNDSRTTTAKKRKGKKWYFVTKIVLTYCEKKMF